MQDNFFVKVILMGAQGVGKSCLLKQLLTQLDHHPAHKILSPIEKNSDLPLNINVLFCLDGIGEVKLNISEYPNIDANVNLKTAVCVSIICFSATDMQSFKKASDLIDSGSKFFTFDCNVKILVSTKNDLQQTQKVTYSHPKKLADKKQMIFVATSAKANINILPLFEVVATVVSDVLHKRKIDITNIKIQPLSAFEKPQKVNVKISSNPSVISSSSSSTYSGSSSATNKVGELSSSPFIAGISSSTN